MRAHKIVANTTVCITLVGVLLIGMGLRAEAREHHVAPSGKDTQEGNAASPLRTIQAAAEKAQPGDRVIVHAGIYRERIDPPRGGTSDDKRIVYQAAPGEKVVITGSEIVKGWEKVQNDTWKAVLPNGFFGDFNPYKDMIRGDWFGSKGRVHHTGAVYLNGDWRWEAAKVEDVLKPVGAQSWWYGQADEHNTTIWAQFPGVDPNEAVVEINVRRSVFYPKKPGINYITVRGFDLRNAATPWAPPTAEQIGLVGTHWSKGWIIEDNTISHSRCVGVTLGKYGDEWDNRSQSADAYNRTIQRALENGWSRENIGHHIVRNNTISYCEQSGIVGSLGAVFSRITGNTIHDIHVQRLFTGAEQAGIKIHGAIDVEVRGNHIYRSGSWGLWFDWMGQGTRISGNLLHDNVLEDLFVEVNHGPFLVDNNIFLSPRSLLDRTSQGGAYVHNLFAGTLNIGGFDGRKTPFHKAHSTEIAGLHDNPAGDDRYYNNLFVERGNLGQYDGARLPVWMDGNVFLKGAQPSKHEQAPLVQPAFDPGIRVVEQPDGVTLEIALDKAWAQQKKRPLVTTEMLGKAKIPDLSFEQPDGSPYRIDTDYFGRKRNMENPFPGPFENPGTGTLSLKVWQGKREDQETQN